MRPDRALEILDGAWWLSLRRIDDARGCFVKTFTKSMFESVGISLDFQEEYYSISHRDVVRGMHFQLPPHDHGKLVYCALGSVLDVLVDLRAGPGYGRVASTILSHHEPSMLYIPSGIAHGFKSLSEGSLMVYKTTAEYAPSHDAGIRWNSIGFDWKVESPIVSERDQEHPTLESFRSPFAAP